MFEFQGKKIIENDNGEYSEIVDKKINKRKDYDN